MASGKNHDRGILLFTPVWGVVGFHYFGWGVAIALTASHFVGGWWLSPDLDIKSRPFLRWGVLKGIWIPYQRMIPHRNWKSHAPIVGTVIRVVYLMLWLAPVWLIEGIYQVLAKIPLEIAIACLIGLELSAINHLFLDGLIVPFPKSVRNALKGK